MVESPRFQLIQRYAIIFWVSLLCIALELLLTRLLNLKTWNHVVYVIIPFAVLGHGIGGNLYLIFRKKIDAWVEAEVLAGSLFALAVATPLVARFLIYQPIRLIDLREIFTSPLTSSDLIFSYLAIMIPFVLIGFLVVYLFSRATTKTAALYAVDLVGAGVGAVACGLLLNQLGLFNLILLGSAVSGFLAALIFIPKHRPALAGAFVLSVLLIRIPEPGPYFVDGSKEWEHIPSSFSANGYRTILSEWSLLGRTEVFQFPHQKVRDYLYSKSPVTFNLNVWPTPEFSYFVTNYAAGTPVYKLSEEGLRKANSRTNLFSDFLEAPYLFFDRPRVVVIGAGGGRDIATAQSHAAQEVIGAEINPITYKHMSPGGSFWEYSGKVYTSQNTRVVNEDGRYLVKTLPAGQTELIVLNGVDTLAGLSTGAYAYAESYLYTKNAMEDYWRLLSDDGIINFNRWLEADDARETLRLFVIAVNVLREQGVEDPLKHIALASYHGWGLMLIKKSPFTSEQIQKLNGYLTPLGPELLFPVEMKVQGETKNHLNAFSAYADAFQNGIESYFLNWYPYDISVIDDDSPFFFKYYKLKDFNFFDPQVTHHPAHGTIAFLAQAMILIHAAVLILVFIFLPLWVFQKEGVQKMRTRSVVTFVSYFAAIGLGFMFVEIPLMQRLTLLLGSPLHAISVCLAALLVFSGLGSWGFKQLQAKGQLAEQIVIKATYGLGIYSVIFASFGMEWINFAVGWTFIARILFTLIVIFPMGVCLGVFFPAGLQKVKGPEQIAWAWGINCGFTVLGSLLALIIAQFYGFSVIFESAAVLYVGAALLYGRLNQEISSSNPQVVLSPQWSRP